MSEFNETFSFNNNSGAAVVDEYSDLLTELHELYTQDQPTDVLQYCANFFQTKLQQQRQDFFREQQNNNQFETEHHPLAENGFISDDDSFISLEEDALFDQEEEEEIDEFSTEFSTTTITTIPTNYNRARRTSVSAESMAPSTQGFIKKFIQKTPEQIESIKKSVNNNFLFKSLDEDHAQDVVNAMVEMCVRHGNAIIEQGGVGDFFYVVQTGTFDCFIGPNKVASYTAGGSFGELALMYNAPRAATVIATLDATLWALDRVTFRTLLMENTSKKRKLYESFLEEVALLKSLEAYERHKIADALESVYFNDGDQIILEGDIGDHFYIIESGLATVYKIEDGERLDLNELERGGYFGELALLNDSPRAATVIAKGRLKCATLGKKAFTRLLGPVHEILKRNSENYYAIINQQ
ncbi:cyclic nucleotide-binding-like protein [Pilaira anomala]|nr:cyclic nucleotide-binding-like protein [Pilaira anomala]